MPLYDEPDLMLQTIREFLIDRPEWQSRVLVSEEGTPRLLPPTFFHFVACAEHHGLITDDEAECWLEDLGERITLLEEVHRRIDAVDPE
jgi:hypothetical protein